jgi:Retroviral aspartyl protease
VLCQKRVRTRPRRPRRRKKGGHGRGCGSCYHPAGDFKLLRGASESRHPSQPSQLFLAIASIFSFSVCKVKEFLQPNRPYVNVQIRPSVTAALYDSGADISCMSETEFRHIPVDARPRQITDQKKSLCVSAGGSPLLVKGIYNCPISLLGRKTEHPFRVIKGLKEPVILGADFINKHLLLYDPKFKRVQSRHENEWAVSPI